jgi:hypothetical protein
MATRCKIGVADMTRGIRSIYCHWDGYPEHVGKMLLKHYNTAQARDELIALGHLSSLGSKIGEKHPFSPHDAGISGLQHEELYGDWCTAYGRDRNDDNTQAEHYATGARFARCTAGEEWVYLWHPLNEQWMCKAADDVKYRPVADVLLQREQEKE